MDIKINMNKILIYIISFIIIILVSLSGQYFTSKNINTSWYECIKSPITPPGYIFPIVWTILYIFIGISLARTVIINDNTKKIISLFIINLLLNVSWCYTFFYKKNPKLALIHIALILISAFAIIYITSDRITKYLLTPYVIWLCFAMILNIISIKPNCQMNN